MVRRQCVTLELSSAFDQSKRVNLAIAPGNAIPGRVSQVRLCIDPDLDRRLFFYMPLVHAIYYEQDELFGPRVKDRFPEANKEIIAAGNCYATGAYTACV